MGVLCEAAVSLRTKAQRSASQLAEAASELNKCADRYENPSDYFGVIDAPPLDHPAATESKDLIIQIKDVAAKLFNAERRLNQVLNQ